jgi:hypothetical protein
MANTPRSRKSKGKRLQNEVRDLILETFDEFEPDDVVSAVMGDSGVDLKLSPFARKKFPYSIECKNQEKLNLWGSIQQAEDNAKDETIPVVVFKRNRSKTYAIVPVEHFIELVSRALDTD